MKESQLSWDWVDAECPFPKRKDKCSHGFDPKPVFERLPRLSNNSMNSKTSPCLICHSSLWPMHKTISSFPKALFFQKRPLEPPCANAWIVHGLNFRSIFMLIQNSKTFPNWTPCFRKQCRACKVFRTILTKMSLLPLGFFWCRRSPNRLLMSVRKIQNTKTSLLSTKCVPSSSASPLTFWSAFKFTLQTFRQRSLKILWMNILSQHCLPMRSNTTYFVLSRPPMHSCSIVSKNNMPLLRKISQTFRRLGQKFFTLIQVRCSKTIKLLARSLSSGNKIHIEFQWKEKSLSTQEIWKTFWLAPHAFSQERTFLR